MPAAFDGQPLARPLREDEISRPFFMRVDWFIDSFVILFNDIRSLDEYSGVYL